MGYKKSQMVGKFAFCRLKFFFWRAKIAKSVGFFLFKKKSSIWLKLDIKHLSKKVDTNPNVMEWKSSKSVGSKFTAGW